LLKWAREKSVVSSMHSRNRDRDKD
jgi:hypothetical protein